MTCILDTSQFPAADRADAVRETLARVVVHVDIDFPEPTGLVGHAAITNVGDLQVCSVRSNATKVERTRGWPVMSCRPASSSACSSQGQA